MLEFTRDDLKVGMMVEVKNGTKYEFFPEIKARGKTFKNVMISDTGFMRVDDYSYDLTHPSDEYSVVSVYNIGRISEGFQQHNLEIVFQRKKQTESDKKIEELEKRIEDMKQTVKELKEMGK